MAISHRKSVIEIFNDEVDVDLAFIVTPLLRKFNDPPFATVDEVVDFVLQTLEVSLFLKITVFTAHTICCAQGLAYMHEHRVAHRYLYWPSSCNYLLTFVNLGTARKKTS